MRVSDKLLRCLLEASGMDSACLALNTPGGYTVESVGLLAGQLQGLSTEELDAMSSLVGDIRSCYTDGHTSGRGFVGTDALRNGGARRWPCSPCARRRRIGTLIFAHSRPLRLTADESSH
jgi:hypothetical protein